MTEHVLASRRVPCDWTDEHRMLARTLHATDATPEWLEHEVMVVDVNGTPAGTRIVREAAISNCPPNDQRIYAEGGDRE
jgi:hypothetical protein